MDNIFFDPNFYILISFCVFAFFAISKFKQKLLDFLIKYSNEIKDKIKIASENKSKAISDLSSANQLVENLPSEINKIFEDHEINTKELENSLNNEIKKYEHIEILRLERVKNLRIQSEYFEKVDEICNVFKSDIKNSTLDDKNEIFKQSLDLLDFVKI